MEKYIGHDMKAGFARGLGGFRVWRMWLGRVWELFLETVGISRRVGGFRVAGLRPRVAGLRSRVKGLGFRV